jgi:predicted nucleic-acid-binding protein
MRAVDTNVVVRLMARDDAEQVISAEHFIETGAWISLLVLAESMWVLATSYGRSAADIQTFISMLLNHEHFTVEHRDVVTVALDAFKRRPSLGFTDCLVLELARRAGNLPLGTFDRNLAKLDGTERLS